MRAFLSFLFHEHHLLTPVKLLAMQKSLVFGWVSRDTGLFFSAGRPQTHNNPLASLIFVSAEVTGTRHHTRLHAQRYLRRFMSSEHMLSWKGHVHSHARPQQCHLDLHLLCDLTVTGRFLSTEICMHETRLLKKCIHILSGSFSP